MLYDKLKQHAKHGAYPMHMPGHKRNHAFMPPCVAEDAFPYDIDITEIHGFDDLHDPKGVLLETSRLAASLYGSREAFLLTCGSTAGILAAIGAHTRRGDVILADARCHQSVPNAARLFGLELEYITPGLDAASHVPCSITPAGVEAALLQRSDARLAVITSPSYEGVVSDIAAIADIAHNAGALLLVDCAHGAHLGFSEYFPKNPVTLGADAAVMSLHKTLPALTQCSLLHLCSERADSNATRQMLRALQTSSPSYVLMASIDYCLRLLQSDADRLFGEYERNLARFYSQVSNLGNIEVLRQRDGFFALDPGKIVIFARCASPGGFELSEMLREGHGIELERTAQHYTIAMTSICDPPDAYTRLAEALAAVDGKPERRF